MCGGDAALCCVKLLCFSPLILCKALSESQVWILQHSVALSICCVVLCIFVDCTLSLVTIAFNIVVVCHYFNIILVANLWVIVIDTVLWLPLCSDGQGIMFYSCDLFTYLFFALLSLRQKNATPLDLCQDAGMWCNVITQTRGSRLYPLHSEGQKSANFAPQLDDGETLNCGNLKTPVSTSLSHHNCQALYTSAL